MERRGNNASYTRWSSFAIVEGKDLEFIVHLDKPTEVRKVVFGSLFNPAMRMLPAGVPLRSICRRSAIYSDSRKGLEA